MIIVVFSFTEILHRNVFGRMQITMYSHWFRKGSDDNQATSHYVNQWWPNLLKHEWKKKRSFEKDGHLIIVMFNFCLSGAICKVSIMLCHQGNNLPDPRLLSRPFEYDTLNKLTSSMTFWNQGKWININRWQHYNDVIWAASRSSSSVIQLFLCNTVLDQHYCVQITTNMNDAICHNDWKNMQACAIRNRQRMFMWVIILTNCLHGQDLCTKH